MYVLEQQRPRGHQHLHLSPIYGHQPSGTR
jgi:hypothetical protein